MDLEAGEQFRPGTSAQKRARAWPRVSPDAESWTQDDRISDGNCRSSLTGCAEGAGAVVSNAAIHPLTEAFCSQECDTLSGLGGRPLISCPCSLRVFRRHTGRPALRVVRPLGRNDGRPGANRVPRCAKRLLSSDTEEALGTRVASRRPHSDHSPEPELVS